MHFGTCAACGCRSSKCCYVDEIADNGYDERVQQDYEERNYRSFDNICSDCLDETESLLSED